MYSSKNILGVYFVKYFQVKNSVFGVFKVNKCGKPAIFAPFSYILGGLEGLFDFYDPLHHHPRVGTPPPTFGAPSSSLAALTVSISF
jgi:hypothetical protein